MPRENDGFIDIAMPENVRTIPATLHGQLAIHRQAGIQDKRWAITHVPTGLWVVKDIPSIGQAVNDTSTLCLLNWDFYDPLEIPTVTREFVERNYGLKFARSETLEQWRKVWRRRH